MEVTHPAGTGYVGDGDPLFVAVDQPPQASAAVLVCGSVGWEFTKNYRCEVLLGRRLAAAGVTVARFHYRGLGESGGSFGDLTLDSMLADAAQAAGLLRAQAGIGPAAIVGIRAGAVIAARLSRRLGGVPLAFWDPVLDGNGYLRELVRLRRVWQATHGGAPEGGDFAADGSLEVLGYRLSPGLVGGLRDLRLGDELRPGPAVLSLHTSAVPAKARDLAAALVARDGGTGPDLLTVPGRIDWWLKRAVFEPEEESGVCTGLISRTVEWVSAHSSATNTTPTTLAAPLRPTAAFRGIPRRVTTVPAGQETLAGVFVEPASGGADVAAVLLNCGSYHPASGPIGLWAQLADRLSELGVASLRVAYRGVGDSTGQVEDFDLTRPCTTELVAARAEFDSLGFHQHVLIGGCLGARTACAASLDGVIGLGLVALPWHVESLAKGLDLRSVPAPGAAADGEPPWLNRGLLRDFTRCVGQVPVRLVYCHGDRYRRDFEAARAGALGQVLERAGSRVGLSVLNGPDSMFATRDVVSAITGFVMSLVRPSECIPDSGRGAWRVRP